MGKENGVLLDKKGSHRDGTVLYMIVERRLCTVVDIFRGNKRHDNSFFCYVVNLVLYHD